VTCPKFFGEKGLKLLYFEEIKVEFAIFRP
jgi:hypothetical protein